MWSVQADTSHPEVTVLFGIMAMLVNETVLDMDADTGC